MAQRQDVDVCESCTMALMDEGTEMGFKLDWGEAVSMARTLGADVCDHSCSARDEGEPCGCACRWHDAG